jgi:hypothetical protein
MGMIGFDGSLIMLEKHAETPTYLLKMLEPNKCRQQERIRTSSLVVVSNLR